MYITRLASNEIFSPSKKVRWEVGQATDLSATRYVLLVHSMFLMCLYAPVHAHCLCNSFVPCVVDTCIKVKGKMYITLIRVSLVFHLVE